MIFKNNYNRKFVVKFLNRTDSCAKCKCYYCPGIEYCRYIVCIKCNHCPVIKCTDEQTDDKDY